MYSKCLFRGSVRGKNPGLVIGFLRFLGCFLVSKCLNLKRFTKGRNIYRKQSKSIYCSKPMNTETHPDLARFCIQPGLVCKLSTRPCVVCFRQQGPAASIPLSQPSFIISESIQDASSCRPDVERNTALKHEGMRLHMCVFCLLSDPCLFSTDL